MTLEFTETDLRGLDSVSHRSLLETVDADGNLTGIILGAWLMPPTLFFATRDDLLSILEPIERDRGLVYYPYGRVTESTVLRYTSAALIPNLGLSPTGMEISDPYYLILPSSVPLIFEKNEYAPEMMLVDSHANPSAVVMTPGGYHGDNFIVLGTFSANRDNPDAKQLLKLYQRSLRRTFRRVEDAYVGPIAYERLKGGTRLTDSVRSTIDRDLSVPDDGES